MNKWNTLSSGLLLDNRWVSVRRNAVELPNGMTIDDFYTITIPDAAGIVAVTEDGQLILKREYRYGPDCDLIEIPAGTFEPGETDGMAVAKRELLEETGFVSDDWCFLSSAVESSSKLTNRMHLYLARNCRRVAQQKLDATEELEMLLVPLEKAVDMVLSDEICCSTSAHGILKAARMLQR